MITVIYNHENSSSRLADVPANQSLIIKANQTLEEMMMDQEVDKISSGITLHGKSKNQDSTKLIVEDQPNSLEPQCGGDVVDIGQSKENSIISIR